RGWPATEPVRRQLRGLPRAPGRDAASPRNPRPGRPQAVRGDTTPPLRAGGRAPSRLRRIRTAGRSRPAPLPDLPPGSLACRAGATVRRFAAPPWGARASFPLWGSTASMLEQFIQWLLERFRDLGYPGIVVLMAIESSFLPLPSELVMPPAGYLAAKGEMSFVVAVGCGVLGSILGALGNYGLARWLGRAFFVRLGRYVLVTNKRLDRSE